MCTNGGGTAGSMFAVYQQWQDSTIVGSACTSGALVGVGLWCQGPCTMCMLVKCFREAMVECIPAE